MRTSKYRLETPRMILENLSASAAEKLLDFHKRNKAYLRPWIQRSKNDFYTLAHHERMLSNKRILFDKGLEFRFYLVRKGIPDHIIGEIGFSHVIRGSFQSCFLGYMIDEHQQGQGFMTEVIQAGIDFMFLEQNLHRIQANIMPRNKASIRVAEKVGFVQEGYSKDYLLVNGNWEDHEQHVIFNPHWKATA